MKFLAILLLLATLAAADDTDKLIDQLFHADEAKRAAARVRILQLETDVLDKLLERIEAQQKSAERVMQIHAVRDLRSDEALWAVAKARLEALDAEIREQESGVLIVQANRKTHADVAKILAEYRERLATVVTISSAIVQLGDGVTMPRAFDAGAFEKWVAKHDVSVEHLPRLTCRNGQSVEITTMRHVSYVEDFEVEVAQGTLIADPVVATLPSGLELGVRAIAGKHIDLHIDVRSAQLAQPLKETNLPLAAGEPVKIQSPESRSLRVRTSRSVTPGAATVVDLGNRCVLVITADSMQLDK